jgi:hypothetical protein
MVKLLIRSKTFPDHTEYFPFVTVDNLAHMIDVKPGQAYRMKLYGNMPHEIRTLIYARMSAKCDYVVPSFDKFGFILAVSLERQL